MAIKPKVPQSPLLAAKREEDILSPQPRVFTLGEESFDIYPLPDSALMHVADALQSVTGLFDGLAKTGFALTALSAGDVLPLVPQIVKCLVPCQSKLIAAALRKPEQWVADSMPLARKLECLRLIVEAEDLPLIVKNFLALAGLFTPQPAPTTEATEAVTVKG